MTDLDDTQRARAAAPIPAQAGAAGRAQAPYGPDSPDPAFTPATLGSLAYVLFAVQQPGPVSGLLSRADAEREGILSPVAPAQEPAADADPFLRRQNLLGEVSLLDL